jgi:predicted nucleic-acid-binding protein
VKIAFDTNVIVRLLIADDPVQLEQARQWLAQASEIALPIVALSEAVWVMRRAYRIPRERLVPIVQELIADERVRCDRVLVAAGIAIMQRGGDFADAVIEADGRRLGAQTLATFDEQAARLLADAGASVICPR